MFRSSFATQSVLPPGHLYTKCTFKFIDSDQLHTHTRTNTEIVQDGTRAIVRSAIYYYFSALIILSLAASRPAWPLGADLAAAAAEEFSVGISLLDHSSLLVCIGITRSQA